MAAGPGPRAPSARERPSTSYSDARVGMLGLGVLSRDASAPAAGTPASAATSRPDLLVLGPRAHRLLCRRHVAVCPGPAPIQPCLVRAIAASLPSTCHQP